MTPASAADDGTPPSSSSPSLYAVCRPTPGRLRVCLPSTKVETGPQGCPERQATTELHPRLAAQERGGLHCARSCLRLADEERNKNGEMRHDRPIGGDGDGGRRQRGRQDERRTPRRARRLQGHLCQAIVPTILRNRGAAYVHHLSLCIEKTH